MFSLCSDISFRLDSSFRITKKKNGTLSSRDERHRAKRALAGATNGTRMKRRNEDCCLLIASVKVFQFFATVAELRDEVPYESAEES